MKKTVLVVGVYIAYLFILFEGVGYYATVKFPELYFNSAPLLADLQAPATEQKFNHFMEYNFSSVTGWNNPQAMTATVMSTPRKRALTYSFDENGVRTYPGYDPDKVEVLLAGDDYIYGSELSDDETVAAKLFRQTGRMGANLAVRGFDGVQSFLRLQELRPHFPKAKMVVLSIMYEQVLSLENSNRMIIQGNRSFNLNNFKPFMKNGVIQLLDPAIFGSYETFVQATRDSVKHDDAACPPPKFPYSYALLQAAQTEQFRRLRYENSHATVGYEFGFLNQPYENDILQLLSEFQKWSEGEHLIPVVYFLPKSGVDMVSADYWIRKHARDLPGLSIYNLNMEGNFARQEYSLTGGGPPTSAGARQIAKQFAKALDLADPVLTEPAAPPKKPVPVAAPIPAKPAQAAIAAPAPQKVKDKKAPAKKAKHP